MINIKAFISNLIKEYAATRYDIFFFNNYIIKFI